MGRFKNSTGRSTSSSSSFNDGKSQENQITDKDLDIVIVNASKLSENVRKIRKEINQVFKPDDESDPNESIYTAEELRKIMADADEMVNVMKSNVEKAKGRKEKLDSLADVTERIEMNSSKYVELARKLRSQHETKIKWRFKIKGRKNLSWKISTAVIGAVALILFLV